MAPVVLAKAQELLEHSHLDPSIASAKKCKVISASQRGSEQLWELRRGRLGSAKIDLAQAAHVSKYDMFRALKHLFFWSL